MSRLVRWVVGAAMLASLGVTVPARAGAAPLRSWSIQRTTKHPVPFRMRVEMKVPDTSDRNEGMLLTLRVLRQEGKRAIGDFGFGGAGREFGVRTYGIAGAPDVACASTCHGVYDTGLFDGWSENENSPADSEWFVAADNLDVTITVSKGWRVRQIPNRLTVVSGTAAGAAGARTNHVTVERFTGSVEVPGGRYGSFAHAVIPCTSAGVGSARFTGGRIHDRAEFDGTLTCDGYTNALAAQVATKATRWRLAGDVTGWTTWPERLVVFDLPW